MGRAENQNPSRTPALFQFLHRWLAAHFVTRDDVAIAKIVRERDHADTGERLTLEELAQSVGIDLSEVGE